MKRRSKNARNFYEAGEERARGSKTMHRLKQVAAAGAIAGVATTVAAGATLGLAGYALWRRRSQADLAGAVVLITGGSRGLGLGMAREFAALGCRLAICARDTGELQRAADELTRSGAEVLPIPCDVGEQEQVQRMVEQVMARYG